MRFACINHLDEHLKAGETRQVRDVCEHRCGYQLPGLHKHEALLDRPLCIFGLPLDHALDHSWHTMCQTDCSAICQETISQYSASRFVRLTRMICTKLYQRNCSNTKQQCTPAGAKPHPHTIRTPVPKGRGKLALLVHNPQGPRLGQSRCVPQRKLSRPQPWSSRRQLPKEGL